MHSKTGANKGAASMQQDGHTHTLRFAGGPLVWNVSQFSQRTRGLVQVCKFNWVGNAKQFLLQTREALGHPVPRPV